MLITQSVKLLECTARLGIPTLLLEQNPGGLGRTVDELRTIASADTCIAKHHFNGLREQRLRDHILSNSRRRWLVIGIEAHICLFQTVHGLLNHGFEVDVVSDCISSSRKSEIDLAIVNMRASGACIKSFETVIYELLESSENRHFKDILRIVKRCD